jgi:hypothetical protein
MANSVRVVYTPPAMAPGIGVFTVTVMCDPGISPANAAAVISLQPPVGAAVPLAPMTMGPPTWVYNYQVGDPPAHGLWAATANLQLTTPLTVSGSTTV